MLGRSNVGKSSLVNALAGRRVAKVSATPGKTRALNVYLLSGGIAGGEAATAPGRQAVAPLPPVYLLDLPGYGYARASRVERASHRQLIGAALRRPRLVGVLWLLDIRREPSNDDRAMQELLAGLRTRVLAAVTKSDRLPPRAWPGRAGDLRSALGLDADQVIVTSSHAGEGLLELRAALAGLVAGHPQPVSTPPGS